MTGCCGFGWHRWHRVNESLLRCARGCGAEAIYGERLPVFPAWRSKAESTN